VSRAATIKHGYTTGARGLASRSVGFLTQTRITPNALTASGVLLCGAASLLVLFENRNEILFYWLAAFVFVVGSLLDILDGALARAGGKTTPFGAFIDSTTDRISEGFVLGAAALVLAREGTTWGIAAVFVALTGSFLVSYTRARAEALGLDGKAGLMGRAERVVLLAAVILLSPFGALPWGIAVLAALTAFTVGQRILSVHRQLASASAEKGTTL